MKFFRLILGKMTFATDLDDIRSRLMFLAYFGLIGHPVFYIVWTEIFPQQYENLEFRIACMMLGLLWLIWDRIEFEGSLALGIFAHATLIICLPYFFAFMYFANQGSTVWLGSLICGILYLALIVDGLRLAAMTCIGFLLAVVTMIYAGSPISYFQFFLEHIPIILFASAGGIAFKLAEQMTIRRNQDKAVALAGTIAHELRTPLMGMKLELDVLSEEADEGEVSKMQEEALSLLQLHQKKATYVIDSLLQNVQRGRLNTDTYKAIWIAPIINDVIQHYPFSPGQEKLVSLDISENFLFSGDEVLMAHVIMNILKNALTSIAAAEKGEITLKLSKEGTSNLLIIKDTGLGMRNRHRNRIFERFYSTTSGGAGLGLSFCYRVIRSFSGQIDCKAKPGEFTSFEIRLPVLENQQQF